MAVTPGVGDLTDKIVTVGNKTLVCSNPHILRKDIWHDGSPLGAPTPLLLFQLSLISTVSWLIDTFLQYLWQSTVVSQIFGGLVFGPSLLGHHDGFLATFFPMKGYIVLDTLAKFGIIFFLFSIGLKMDVTMMVKPGRKALAIGFSAFFLTLILTFSMGIILKKSVTMDARFQDTILVLAASQGLTGFPAIACLLTELKMLNTDMGRLALSSAMICDFVGIVVTAICFSVMGSLHGNIETSMKALLSLVVFMVVVIFLFKPIVTIIRARMIREKTVHENYIVTIFILVLVSSFFGEVIGQHYLFGPLVFGIVVPDGPPLGSALTQKIDTLAIGLLYPTFCAISGLQTNTYSIKLMHVWVVGVLVAFGFLAKIASALLPAFFFNIPMNDAFVLGLILNARGIIELVVYNLWKESQVLNDEEFALAVISVLMVTAIVTPLIRLLYDPSKKLKSFAKSTIQQQLKHDSELRILVGILNHETVPSIINLLEVSHADEDNPMTVIAMALVELLGRTTPVLVSHKEQKTLNRSTSVGSKIFNTLDQFELGHGGDVQVKSFTSISHFDMMHEDICRVAADEYANIVIMPFHKQWTIDGSIGFTSRAMQNMNIRVLENSPCSVGILVDRGILNGSTSLQSGQALYHVGVIFIGGPDDAECLAYGARMARHENVDVTVIRYLLFGSERSKERKEETHLVDQYRRMYAGNDRFIYVEEVVHDAEGLSSSMRKIADWFGLILVGRSHMGSPLVAALTEWSECPELGVVGDMLASTDFGSTATVLVVQQQNMGGKWMQIHRQSIAGKDVGEAQSDGSQRTETWSIPIL